MNVCWFPCVQILSSDIGIPVALAMAALTEPSNTNDDSPHQTKHSARHNSWIRTLLLRTQLDEVVYNQTYTGSGSAGDPYIVDYLHNDRQDAMNLSKQRKWAIAILQSLSTFAVTFASSVYASGIDDVIRKFGVSAEVATLGLSLFVSGFALGPLIWAPLSEVYGRKLVFMVSYTAYTAFSVGAACAPNITSLLVLRFFASAFGSSSMTNAGGVISDMFSKSERGLATGLFSAAPFLGPIFGGFLDEAKGWRWLLGLTAILGGVTWLVTTLATCETYAPYILRCRARALSRATGRVYVSRLDAGKPAKKLAQELWVAFTRPWILMFREPIVLLTSLYIAIVYGTLYMFFAGFPIVFQGARGWSQGIAGLPFIAIAIGVCLATLAAGVDNKRYARLVAAAKAEGYAVEPEARLSTAMVGAVILPMGLFLFAWTTYPSVHWVAPATGAVLFSCGLVMVFISFMGYLIDSCTFSDPLLSPRSGITCTCSPVYRSRLRRVGASGQFVASVPVRHGISAVHDPDYGAQIRAKCKYASEAARVLEMMWSVSVCVDDVSLGALGGPGHRRRALLVRSCHGLHLVHGLSDRLLSRLRRVGASGQFVASVPVRHGISAVHDPDYGAQIRAKCKYASEAARVLEMMNRRHVKVVEVEPNRPVTDVAQLA
nr:efflux pump fubt [Quercus suber]